MEKKKEKHCVQYKAGEQRIEKRNDASLSTNSYNDKKFYNLQFYNQCLAQKGASYVVYSSCFQRLNLDPTLSSENKVGGEKVFRFSL